MGKLEGKVAFITGAARGQGRSHAIRLAQEGADIIAVDICRQIDSVSLPDGHPGGPGRDRQGGRGARPADLRRAGRRPRRNRSSSRRSSGAWPSSARSTSCSPTPASPRWGCTELHSAWQDVIDVNLTGVFNTVETAIPSMNERGAGGAIVLTSSTAGITGIGGPTRGGLGYTAAKHGVVGLMRSYANTLAPLSIRVNTVHPTGVNTPMIVNDVMAEFLAAGPADGQRDGQRAPGRHGRAGRHLQRDRCGWSPTRPATSPA